MSLYKACKRSKVKKNQIIVTKFEYEFTTFYQITLKIQLYKASKHTKFNGNGVTITQSKILLKELKN